MTLPEQQLEMVDKHLADVKQEIVGAANAAVQHDGSIDIPRLGSILSTYARTQPIPAVESTWAQIISVPGIVWISALLALSFGVLSIWYPTMGDIAKVFAGAVVGASGASANQ